VYDETLPTINEPKHPEKGDIQGKNWKDPSSKKMNDPPKRGHKVLGSFVCCLPRLTVFDVFLFRHLLVLDYLFKILEFLETSFYSLFNTCVTMVVCKLNLGTYQYIMNGSSLKAE
jgi:hypothetical protein